MGHLFHHHPTYSDLHIAQRITEDYDIEISARQVKRIRLQNSWLRRHNNPASHEAQDQEIGTFDAVEQLLAEGRIRQYGYRQLITHLARKYGHRPRALHVRNALKLLNEYGPRRFFLSLERRKSDSSFPMVELPLSARCLIPILGLQSSSIASLAAIQFATFRDGEVISDPSEPPRIHELPPERPDSPIAVRPGRPFAAKVSGTPPFSSKLSLPLDSCFMNRAALSRRLSSGAIVEGVE